MTHCKSSVHATPFGLVFTALTTTCSAPDSVPNTGVFSSVWYIFSRNPLDRGVFSALQNQKTLDIEVIYESGKHYVFP